MRKHTKLFLVQAAANGERILIGWRWYLYHGRDDATQGDELFS